MAYKIFIVPDSSEENQFENISTYQDAIFLADKINSTGKEFVFNTLQERDAFIQGYSAGVGYLGSGLFYIENPTLQIQPPYFVITKNRKDKSDYTGEPVYIKETLPDNFLTVSTFGGIHYHVGKEELTKIIGFLPLSPDGFPFTREHEHFPTPDVAENKLHEYIQRYKQQGYYSSPKYGKIPFVDIHHYCDLQTVLAEDADNDGDQNSLIDDKPF